MKWIILLRLFPAIACLFSVPPSSAASISSQLYKGLDGAHEYSRQQTDFGQYELVLGTLNYLYPSSPGETEGFKADKSRIYEGKIDRRVLDLPSHIGSLTAFSLAEKVLRKEGYRIAFSCEGSSCGSIKGWSVFYHDQADGAQSDQFYISATYPEHGPLERVFSAHISRIGKSVRVTFDEVTLLVDIERSIQNYADSVLAHWSKSDLGQKLPVPGYGLGSHELTETMKLKFRAIAKIIDSESHFAVRLLGYTDPLGEEAQNEKLSFDRAKSVADFLFALGISSGSVSFEGRGVFNDAGKRASRKAAPEHRKVIVVAYPKKEVGSLD